MDELLAKYTNEDGTIDKEGLNKELSESYVTKSSYDEQVAKSQGAYAAAKKKYKKSDGVDNSDNENKASASEPKKDNDVDIEALVSNQVQKGMAAYDAQKTADNKLQEDLKRVKPEFRPLVENYAKTTEEFNMDNFLKENEQYVEKINTQSTSVQSNSTTANVSKADQAMNDLLDNI